LRMKNSLSSSAVCASVNHLKLLASGNQLPTNPRPGTDRIFSFSSTLKPIYYISGTVFFKHLPGMFSVWQLFA